MDVLIIIYLIWAIYAGWRLVTGKSVWLDYKTPVSMICKFIVAFFVGGVAGIFYLIYLVFRFVGF